MPKQQKYTERAIMTDWLRQAVIRKGFLGEVALEAKP
jgi:hypothetical protein